MMGSGTQDQPLDILEFSGGITDYYIDGPLNAAQFFENLVLTPTRKPTTRAGINYFVDQQVNTEATRVHLLNHFEEPLTLQARKAFRKSGATTFAQIFGPNNGGATDPALADSAVTSTSILSAASWKGHTFVTTDDLVRPQKFFKNVGGTWCVRNAGLPQPGVFTAVPASAGTNKSYLYAMVFAFTYTVAGQTFTDRSTPRIVQATSSLPIGTGGGTLSDRVLLTPPGWGAVNENWDYANTSAMKIEIYRTILNGKDFYLVDTENGNSTTGVYDTMIDATLLLQTPLYTNGGIVDNDAPPKCKYMHIMGDTGYYAYLKDASGTYPYQLRQSIPGDIDSVPGSFNLDLPEAISGISSHNDKPITMCTNQVFRVEGSFDSFGQGFMAAVQISPNAGGLSHNSIVQTPVGVFWFGNDGVYHTEGYVATKLTPHLNLTYAALTSNATKTSRIQGTYYPDIQCVVWTVCRSDAGNEPDSLLILDLRWGLRLGALDAKQTPATFYFWAGTNFSAVRWINRQLLFGLSSGYLMLLDSTKTSDVRFATSAAPSTWGTKAILYQWTSIATDFGTKFFRKWVTWFMVSCTSSSNLSLAIQSVVDNGKRVADLKPIRYRGSVVWGETDIFWGDAGYIWGRTGTLEYKRRVPKNSLRSMYRQVNLENAKVVLLASDTMGTVLVNASALSVVLNGTLTWPTNFQDYVIAFSGDSYVREFTIDSVSTNTLLYLDPDGQTPVGGTYSFVVRGKPKGEVLNLNGVQMWWQLISKTQTAYAEGESGEPT